MTRTYECMFLIDNDSVRAGWNEAKASVAGYIEKHGGSVVTSRRWAERRLAYPIRHKNRATYMLSYCDLDPTQISNLRRDLDISESVLRYLMLSADEIPAEERELAAAEDSADFSVPEPPADDAVDEPPPAPAEEGEEKASAEAATAEAAPEANAEAKAEATPDAETPKADDETTKTQGEEA